MSRLSEQVIKIDIKSPIYLDKNQIGMFIHEEILNRESRMLPGRLQSAIGIKTNK